MIIETLVVSACARMRLAALLLCGFVPALASSVARAQHSHEHEAHEHGGLHFSHPLLTESPSPDTKLRFDFGRVLNATPRDNVAKLEGEFAFSPAVSVAVTGSHAWSSGEAGSGERTNSIEVSMKGASFAFRDRGVLIGGGLGMDVPLSMGRSSTAEKEHVALEPFVDWALKREAFELVTLAAYSTTIGRSAEREHRVEIRGSGLVAVTKMIDLLGEIEFIKPLSGLERSSTVRLAPGAKIRPWVDRELAFGLSVPLGVGNLNSRSLLASVFYHF